MTYTELPVSPDFGPISALSFTIPADDSLLVASYDNSVCLYNCRNRTVSASLKSPSPVLSLAYSSSKTTLAGLSDGTIRHIDLENMAFSRPIVSIDDSLSSSKKMVSDVAIPVSSGINCFVPLHQTAFVASAYNGTLLVFDSRISQLISKQDTMSKIYAMDASEHTITLGKQNSTVELYDARNLSRPMKSRSTGLRFQVTNLQNLPSKEGYALSSIDGRVSVEYYDESAHEQAKKFAFKCHRISNRSAGEDMVFPVSGLKFHPVYNTLFTAGGDGTVCVWNWAKRKRMKLFEHNLTSQKAISKMDVSADGALLAISVGDDSYMRAESAGSGTASKGSKVLVKQLSDADCRPKS